MINEIIITNAVTGQSITLNKHSSPFIIEEIDWDTPAVSHESYKVPYQTGQFISGTAVETRSPQIVGYVIADTSSMIIGETYDTITWELYYDMLEQAIEDSKQVLDKVISVFQDVLIEAGGYTLRARPTHSPKYSIKESENNEVLCVFTLDFECFDPLFYSGEQEVGFAGIESKFHFPLIMSTSFNKVVFGIIQTRSVATLVNSGDSQAGMIIVLKAVGGSVINPAVRNLTRNEYIAFEELTLSDGDMLTINTNVGEESAVWHKSADSTNVSVVARMSTGSKFLKVAQGEEMFVYDVDESSAANVDMTVTYREQYFNIRGM